ncbi:hypothetical protein GCM10023196_101750 [Actinoallomurus vinaceus]|uniref:Pentapeptide repeat-containing protein n=1 Tax=Actinoallomurus vinaceus TaxID=1080074 RepID=A0ABP8UU35_9ACTN
MTEPDQALDQEPTEPAAAPAGAGGPHRPGRRFGRVRPRRRLEITLPSADEIAALPAKDRLELALQRRQHRQQSVNSIGILFGVVFTAAGLIATALTLRSSQEGQVTDRYTKAVEQLGSDSPEVRLGAIFALQRLAGDSGRDHNTIMDVLAAYVRVHAPRANARTPGEPDADVQAALTVLVGNDRMREPYSLDLHGIRIPGAELASAASNSAGRDTYFHGPYLTATELRREGWHVADLRGANLEGADLSRAVLGAADLGSSNLRQAVLRNAHLYGARLHGADLTGARLNGADLRSADLTGAQLNGADLRSADLTRVRGMTPDQIRRSAVTDSGTRF